MPFQYQTRTLVRSILFACLLLAVAQRAYAGDLAGGLSVVIPATTANDLIARSQNGRILVHGLAGDRATAEKLRAEIVGAKLSGVITVAVWDGRTVLPYAEDLIDELVVDQDALGANAVPQKEIDRVLVPKFGVARIHEKSATRDHRRPMPKTYGEWTHYNHDATNNPVGSDSATGVATGVKWIAEAQASGGSHSLVGGGRLVYFNVAERSNFGGNGGGSYAVMRTRNAFNGLPYWDRTNNDWKKNSIARYEGAVIDGDRLIHLKTRAGPLVATSLVDGKELMTYDAAVINANAESVRIAATTSGGVNAMAILDGRLLYVASGKDLTVLNADTGKLVWRFAADEKSYLGFPCIDRKTNTLAVAVGPLGMASGRMTHFRATEFRGFDAATGKAKWTTPNPITDFIASMATLDGSVYVASAGHLGSVVLNMIGIDAKDGSVRWKQLDMPIGASGTLMLYPDRAYIGRSALTTFDLNNGNILSTLILGNARCDGIRGSALTINNFGHYLDVTDPSKVIWNRREITRNSCGGASTPAYGMRYSADNRCGCYTAIRGLIALGHQTVPAPVPDAQRLTKGPAFARPLGKDMQGWTSFLANDRREAAGGPIKSDKPAKRWQVKITTAPDTGLLANEWRIGDSWNGAITPPTIANGKVYVAETAGRRLVCLDADTGKELWSFVTEGRIDGPPRLTRGRAVIGCRDGSVYCLDASDGALAWKFQAAPSSRLITAYGQLESVWPVYSAIPVVGDSVLVSAGRHPESDGGIAVWALNLATGNINWKRTLDNPRNPIAVAHAGGKIKASKSEMENIFAPNRVSNDVMIADKNVFVMGGKRMQVADGKDIAEHAEFFLMPNWGSYSSPVRRPSQLNLNGPGGWNAQWGLADDNLYRYKVEEGKLKKGSKPGVWGRPICITKDYIVVQLYHANNGALGELVCYPRSAAKDSGPHLWELPSRELRPEIVNRLAPAVAANSMIVAGDRIIMTTSVYDPGARFPSFSPLMIRDLATGKLLHSETLPLPTVDHGIAVADGRLYISLDDGSLLCME